MANVGQLMTSRASFQSCYAHISMVQYLVVSPSTSQTAVCGAGFGWNTLIPFVFVQCTCILKLKISISENSFECFMHMHGATLLYEILVRRIFGELLLVTI